MAAADAGSTCQSSLSASPLFVCIATWSFGAIFKQRRIVLMFVGASKDSAKVPCRTTRVSCDGGVHEQVLRVPMEWRRVQATVAVQSNSHNTAHGGRCVGLSL